MTYIKLQDWMFDPEEGGLDLARYGHVGVDLTQARLVGFKANKDTPDPSSYRQCDEEAAFNTAKYLLSEGIYVAVGIQIPGGYQVLMNVVS